MSHRIEDAQKSPSWAAVVIATPIVCLSANAISATLTTTQALGDQAN
jgi:hypothetical protein